MAKESISKKDIALSCRHIWKVYGEKPEQFFSQGNGAVNTQKSMLTPFRTATISLQMLM